MCGASIHPSSLFFPPLLPALNLLPTPSLPSPLPSYLALPSLSP